mgnify:FL=1
MHHSMTPHASGCNISKRDRRVIILRYCGVSEGTQFKVQCMQRMDTMSYIPSSSH